MSIAGIIFADSYDVELNQLTAKRTLAAVPFAGRYRLIDFNLSNMVNAGILDIGIIMSTAYDSLMNHVRSGSTWDLDRKESGLTYLPPHAFDNREFVYENRLEALQSNLSYLRNLKDDYILMTSCNYVANIDFAKAVEFHRQSGAKITGLYTREPLFKNETLPATRYLLDADGKLTDANITTQAGDHSVVSLNTYVIDREYLIERIEQTMQEHQHSFRRDIVKKAIHEGEVALYEVPETVLFLDDITSYMRSSFALLQQELRTEIFFNEDRPIITKVKDSPPSRYGKTAKAVNSIVADGAVIEGEVRNSIIFRGARIKKGAVVDNCIVMQDTIVGEGVQLHYAVLDKNVIINDGRMLSGYITHPFYVSSKTVI